MSNVPLTQTSFQYSRFKQVITDWTLMIVLFGIVLGFFIARRGELRNGILFTVVFSGLFLLLWFLARSQLTTIVVDETTIKAFAFWGVRKQVIAWKDVNQVEYSNIAAPLQKSGGPQTYIVRPSGHVSSRSARSKGIMIGVELINFPALFAMIERKSVEFGFPIQQVPWRRKNTEPEIS